MNALIHNIKSKYVGRFICVYIIRLFPLPEDFLRADHTLTIDPTIGSGKLSFIR